MKKKEIIEGNIAIMFFDGAEWAEIDLLGQPVKAIKYKDSYYPKWNPPRFDNDWNLLMEIVQKFIQIPHDEFNYDAKAMTDLRKCKASITGLSITDSIETVYNHLLAGIKWYNQSIIQSEKETE